MKNDFELEPWDIALHKFIELFPYPLIRLYIGEDGKSLKLRLKNSTMIQKYLEVARVKILLANLPLVVERDTFRNGEENIIIRYTADKTELLCY